MFQKNEKDKVQVRRTKKKKKRTFSPFLEENLPTESNMNVILK